MQRRPSVVTSDDSSVTIDIHYLHFPNSRGCSKGVFRNPVIVSDGYFLSCRLGKGLSHRSQKKVKICFFALQAMRDKARISANETNANCNLKDFINSEKAIMCVSQDKEPMDYMTAKEMKRLGLQEKST